MALTGPSDGPPLLAPVDLAAAATGAVLAFRALADRSSFDVDRDELNLDGPALLGERAALLGLTRQGSTTPGGSTRMLPAQEGWVAIGLRRPSDVDLVPALIEAPVAGDPWPALRRWLLTTGGQAAVDRAQSLGLPAATHRRDEESRVVAAQPWTVRPLPPAGTVERRPQDRPLVVDMSSLWAGPLATSLLRAAGADVIRLENPNRPDGVRAGPRAFDDLLNAGKLSVAARPEDRLLQDLLARADLVVTSARPRALEQLGLAPAVGRNWLTITGYGWNSQFRDRVAYGDDAAVAAGVVAGPEQAPMFCADAVADPLTGLHAAVVALWALIDQWEGGPARHLDVSLFQVTAHLTRHLDPVPAGESVSYVAAPRARRPRGVAAALGADQDHPLVRLIP